MVAESDVIGQKWDQCVARLVVNSGLGAAAGIGLSALLFRRRFWPIPLSIGFAAGLSFQECLQTFGSSGFASAFPVTSAVRNNQHQQKALIENDNKA